MIIQIVCLWHLLGNCKWCTPDLDLSHHPNNYDCKRFIPVSIFTVTTGKEESEHKQTPPNTKE